MGYFKGTTCHSQWQLMREKGTLKIMREFKR
jgi:hypothetical protein